MGREEEKRKEGGEAVGWGKQMNGGERLNTWT